MEVTKTDANYIVYRYGWICPKCGNVYSPEYFECMNCNHSKSVTSVWAIDNNDCQKTTAYNDFSLNSKIKNKEV